MPRQHGKEQRSIIFLLAWNQNIKSEKTLTFITTDNESLVYSYDTKTRQQFKSQIQYCQNESATLQNCKDNVDSFFDIHGIVHEEYLPIYQAVINNFNREVLKQLKQDIHRKPLEKWKKKFWFLHHDNAPAYKSLVFRKFLT